MARCIGGFLWFASFLLFASLSGPVAVAQNTPKTYVLPPLDVCASVRWQGDGYWELLVTNNCPAAVEVDLTFNGGTRANVFCEGYDTCKARFPKRRVGDQFNYRLRYASE